MNLLNKTFLAKVMLLGLAALLFSPSGLASYPYNTLYQPVSVYYAPGYGQGSYEYNAYGTSLYDAYGYPAYGGGYAYQGPGSYFGISYYGAPNMNRYYGDFYTWKFNPYTIYGANWYLNTTGYNYYPGSCMSFFCFY